MIVERRIRWVIKPAGHVTSDHLPQRDGVEWHVEDVEAFALLGGMQVDDAMAFAEGLGREVMASVRAVAVIRDTHLAVHGPLVVEIDADRRKNWISHIPSVTVQVRVGEVRLEISPPGDSEGLSSEARRRRSESRLARAAAKHVEGNHHLRVALERYDDALQYPEWVLWHAVDVRDAVRAGMKQLDRSIADLLDKNQRRAFEIANSPEIEKSRHSGKATGPTRRASAAELATISKAMRTAVVGFIGALDEHAEDGARDSTA